MHARTLPPLNMLKAFEAAARHQSFAKAAAELAVTPAAVSHQIKALEDYLQCRLFVRFNRRLALTDEAKAYLPVLAKAFDDIAAATRQLRTARGNRGLRIKTLQSFAAKWLVPRLPDFAAASPDVTPMVSTAARRAILASNDFDAAIWLGGEDLGDFHAEPLFADTVFPVCSPALLERGPPLRAVEDLARHTLLHDSSIGQADNAPTWHGWFSQTGTVVKPARSVSFSDSALMLQAAIAGHGVAIGRSSLVLDDLAAGYLACPFGPPILMRYSWWLVQRPEDVERPDNQAFRAWLLAEIKTQQEKIKVMARSMPIWPVSTPA